MSTQINFPDHALSYWVSRIIQGKAVNIACIGDSTTDGFWRDETGDNTTTPFTRNTGDLDTTLVELQALFPTAPNEDLTYLADDGTGSAVTTPDGGAYVHNELRATASYPAILKGLLREKYGTNVEVWNAGYRGQRMGNGWAYYMYELMFPDPMKQPDVVLIQMGTNDTRLNSDNYKKYEGWLEKIVEKIISVGATPVILSPDPYTGREFFSGNARNTDLYKVILSAQQSVADKYNLVYFDVGKYLSDWITYNFNEENHSDLLWDNTHLNDAGYVKKAEYVSTLFEPLLFRYSVNDQKLILHPNDIRSHLNQNFNGVNAVSEVSHLSDFGQRFNKVPYISNDASSYAAEGHIFNTYYVLVESEKQPVLYYRNFANGRYFGSEQDAPKIILNGEEFTDPMCGMNESELHTSDVPICIGGLKYGLNTIEFKVAVEDSFHFIGHFEMSTSYTNWRILNDQNITGGGDYTSGLERDYIQRNLLPNGPEEYIVPANTGSQVFRQIVTPRENSDMGNVGSLLKTGDKIEIELDCEIPAKCGLVFFGGKGGNLAGYGKYENDGALALYNQGSYYSFFPLSSGLDDKGYTVNPETYMGSIEREFTVAFIKDSFRQYTAKLYNKHGNSKVEVYSSTFTHDVTNTTIGSFYKPHCFGTHAGLWSNQEPGAAEITFKSSRAIMKFYPST